MKLLSVLLLTAAAAGATAGCINSCSGHGFCGAYDLCTCYGNWAGNDCSGRVCPQTKAWVDTAVLANDAHNYATCGNKGDCQGKSGECACYEPFEGKGCRRMACPNGCSGHGTCEYMEELALNNNCKWDGAAQALQTNCIHSSITGLNGGESFANNNNAITYTGWDRNKIQGCQCDPGWAGIDCSGRICPMGNDPLRTRNADDSYPQEPTTFQVSVGWTDDVDYKTADADVPTFVLAFTDTYNEKWYTRPIPINANAAGNGYQAELPAGALTGLSNMVYKALLDLPNAAITGTSVDPVTGVASTAGTFLLVSAAHLGTGDAQNHVALIDITFNSPHNSGPLTNKLECHFAGCTHAAATNTGNPGGCSPKYGGLVAGGAAAVNAAACTVKNVPGTDGARGTTNQDTCSRRGSCDGGSGLCACYEGYTDEDCSMQTVLV